MIIIQQHSRAVFVVAAAAVDHQSDFGEKIVEIPSLS
jgi:hypothetical protein